MKIEYNSDLKEGDEVLFDFGDKEYTGVVKSGRRCFLDFSDTNGGECHLNCVDQVFSRLGYPNKVGIPELMEKTLGYSDDTGIWPYTKSPEDLRKFLDEL